MFGRDGYMGASMNAVARAAGVSKGLLHYHFTSKEHLLIEAQRAAFRIIHARFAERFEDAQDRTAALDALDAIWGSVRDLYAWSPFLLETLSLAGQNEDVRQHLDGFYSESMELMEDGIRRLYEQRGETPPVPPERLVKLIRVGMHGLLVELAMSKTDEDLERVDQAWRDLRELLAQHVIAAE